MASFLSAAVRVGALALAAAPAFAQIAGPAAADLIPAGSAEVRAFLDASGSPQPLCATAEGRDLWAAVQELYAARGDRPAWIDGDRVTPAGQRLLAALAAAADEGLDPARYDPAAILPGGSGVLRVAVGGGPTPREAAVREVALMVALARYAADLGRGRVDPARVSVMWRVQPRRVDVRPILRQAVESGRPDDVLDSVRPRHPQYAALRDALRRYAALAAQESQLPTLPAALRLRPGARNPQVAALRARLAFWGDASGSAAAAGADVLDRPLVDALKRFQARHGLAAGGTLDAETIEALNAPAADRVRQIALNLERWRWQALPEAGRSVLVNIPTFELHGYAGGREALAMRVVTGRPDTPTPVFAQDMTAVVFSPYWNVPTNIALGETMPAVLRDPSYLQRMNLEVLRGDQVVDPRRVDWGRGAAGVSFRQRPGARNALGLVKFLLPNSFNVYLHDTPSTALFLRPQRAFSHGCVRLEKPEALARWVLDGMPGWTPARIAGAMRAGRESAVSLPQAIPVGITYFTVWVDADGTVEFRPDVYRHDAAQAPLLETPAPPSPAAAVAAAG
jgi:murein L,D-transpeptidase YcbB/YkuD